MTANRLAAAGVTLAPQPAEWCGIHGAPMQGNRCTLGPTSQGACAATPQPAEEGRCTRCGKQRQHPDHDHPSMGHGFVRDACPVHDDLCGPTCTGRAIKPAEDGLGCNPRCIWKSSHLDACGIRIADLEAQLAATPQPAPDALRVPLGSIARPVLIDPDVIDTLDLHLADGSRITAAWGEPDTEGWWTPTFTRHEPESSPVLEREP